MPSNHAAIRKSAGQAWEKFHNTQVAYIQALLFVERAVQVADVDPELKDLHVALGQSSAILGLDQSSYFRANLFFSQVSGIELFLQETLRAVIKGYPAKVGSAQFKLVQITEVDSIETLVEQATDEYLNKVMYKKPFEYLRDVSETLSIEEAALRPAWPDFVEIKARRDVGIHNNWICNSTYLRKLAEVEIPTTAVIGDSLAPNTNEYLFKVTDALGKVGKQIVDQVFFKYA